MSSVESFFLEGCEHAAEPFHYTACGLDNVYLCNGFTPIKNSYGSGVSIERLDELHETIARSLIEKPDKLTGKEIRFLRKQMNVTQELIAQWLSSDVQAVGRYERGECENIPGPVDKLIRTIYQLTTMPDEDFKKLSKLIKEERSATVAEQPRIFLQKNSHWEVEKLLAA